ncbi:hypothetical protein [Streptomyces sp. yr375]|nr:hypothetical protein [Streptomyces sp. yr375]
MRTAVTRCARHRPGRTSTLLLTEEQVAEAGERLRCCGQHPASPGE